MPAVFVLIWSTGFIVARYGMPHAPPMKFLAVRYALSVLAFLLWAWLARAAWPRNGRQFAHLAVTGSVAIGDGLIQQALGHGLASRLSAKLGEGVLNGFLTARLGLAALDVIRPLPFAALPRPALSDLIKDLTRG